MNINTGLHPRIYFKFYARRYPFNQLAVNSSTNICIEGYPRCANSYAVYALVLANNNLNVGHHLHVPAQIFKSVQMEIPTIVPIRTPEEAVSSFLVFQKSTNADLYLKAYVKFYKSLFHLLDKVVIADFTTIIGDFNKVIQAVNNKYRTNYQVISDLKQRQDEIFKKLKEINERFFGCDRNKTMYPDKTREIHKQKAKKYTIGSKFLGEANEIYERIKKASV